MNEEKLKERIQHNKKVRAAVKQIVELIPDTLADFPGITEDEVATSIATELAARSGKRLVEDGPDFIMTDLQAQYFEQEVIPYGLYEGTVVGDVSCSYWLHCFEGSFAQKIKRYIRSPRFQYRQERGL